MSAGRDVVEGSIARIRLLVGLVVLVLVAKGGLQADEAVTIALILAGAAAVVIGEPIVRRVLGSSTASMFAVAVDLALVLAVLGAEGVQVGEPASLLLVLPLLEAAVRHGLLGTLVAWFGASFAILVYGSVDAGFTHVDLALSLQAIGVLLLVTLPAAHLSEHLVNRVDEFAVARSVADRRAELLAAVLDASGRLAALDEQEALDEATRSAADLAGEGAAVLELVEGEEPRVRAGFARPPLSQLPNDVLEQASARDGVASSYEWGAERGVLVGLGGRLPLLLRAFGPNAADPFVRDGLEILAAHLRIALSAAALHSDAKASAAEWARRAATDPLTGLANRSAAIRDLQARLSRESRARPVIVFFVDLDHFKAVNDAHGHEAGDRVLQAIAMRLAATSIQGRLVARLGGDEFLFVAEAEEAAADQLAADLRAATAVEITLQSGATVRVGSSIGMVAVAPSDRPDAAAVLRLADARMYEQKRGLAVDAQLGNLRIA